MPLTWEEQQAGLLLLEEEAAPGTVFEDVPTIEAALERAAEYREEVVSRGWEIPEYEEPVPLTPPPVTIPSYQPPPVEPISKVKEALIFEPLKGEPKMVYNGMGGLYDGGGGQLQAQPVLFGALVPAALVLLRRQILTLGFITLGLARNVLARFGANSLKYLLGGTLALQVVSMIDHGFPDETQVKVKKRKRRYSIGTNPRVNTLLKVAKRVDNIFISYDRRISKFRSRLRGTGRAPRSHGHVVTSKRR